MLGSCAGRKRPGVALVVSRSITAWCLFLWKSFPGRFNAIPNARFQQTSLSLIYVHARTLLSPIPLPLRGFGRPVGGWSAL